MKTLDKIQLNDKYKKIHSWKVRDAFIKSWQDWKRILITTDRVSAFDKAIASIPYKWQVLNQIAGWFFDNVSDICPNQIIAVPDWNITIAKEAKMIPLEFIIRWYLTGSSWRAYEKWEKTVSWVSIPDWMKKHQKFENPIVTPTTKSENDEPISYEEILEEWIISKENLDKVYEISLKLYKRWAEIAEKRWLIFVDTKYEFWFDKETWELILCDEVNTPDSSRYWEKDSYEDYLSSKIENPRQLSKEFLREFLMEKWFSWKWEIPELDEEMKEKISERYIEIYEKITWEKFQKADINNINERIQNNLDKYFW